MRRKQGGKQKKKKERKQVRVEDPTLHPSLHAYTDDNERCFYCGCDRDRHKEQVVIKDGKRLIMPI